MSLKRKIISGVISAFAVATFTTFASAQTTDNTQQQDSTNQRQKREKRMNRDNFGGRGHRGGGMMRGLEKLNLTDTQKEQIRSIMEANRPNPADFEEVKGLMQAKRNGTLTAEQETKLKNFRDQMKLKHELTENQILSVLTQEQRTELEKMRSERKERREQRQKERQNRKNSNTEQKDN